MNRFLIIMLLFQFASVNAQNNRNLLKTHALIEQKKYSEALQNAALEAKQNNKNLKLVADCHYYNAQYKKALALYLKCDSIYGGTCNLEIAKCYSLLKQPEPALNWLKKYLAGKNKIPEYEILKDTAFKTVSTTESWKNLMKTEWYSTSERECNAISASLKNGNYKEALEQTEAAKNSIGKPEYNYLTARAYEGINQYNQALYYINLAIEVNTRNENYYFTQSEIEFCLRKYTECSQSITKSISLNPGCPKYFLLRGKSEYLSGNFIQSDSDLLLYLQLYPESDEANFYKGKLEFQKGNYQTAMSYLEKTVKYHQSNPEYFIAYGEAGFYAGKYQTAEENISMSLDLSPNNANANLLKGQIRLYFEDKQSACVYLLKAINNGSKIAAGLYETNCKN